MLTHTQVHAHTHKCMFTHTQVHSTYLWVFASVPESFHLRISAFQSNLNQSVSLVFETPFHLEGRDGILGDSAPFWSWPEREADNQKGVLSKVALGGLSCSSRDLEVTGRESVVPRGATDAGWQKEGAERVGLLMVGNEQALGEGKKMADRRWKGQRKIAPGKEVRGWARVLGGRCIISVGSFRISSYSSAGATWWPERATSQHLRINNVPYPHPHLIRSSQSLKESGEARKISEPGVGDNVRDKIEDEGKGGSCLWMYIYL